MLRVFNDTARYVDQGGGKRKGAFAIYLEPWHGDIFDWLELRKNHGSEESRARDLFYGLWCNDLFMERVENNREWTLFCPSNAPGLADVWGDDFKELYERCASPEADVHCSRVCYMHCRLSSEQRLAMDARVCCACMLVLDPAAAATVQHTVAALRPCVSSGLLKAG